MLFAAVRTFKICARAPHLPSLAVSLERREGGKKERDKSRCKVLNPTAGQCGETLEVPHKDGGIICFLSILPN